MNIFELSLFKEYVYYPYTTIHFVSINRKIFIVAFYIILLTAISNDLVIIFSILFLYIAFQYNKLAYTNLTVSTRLYYIFNIFLIILLSRKHNVIYSIISLRYQLKTVVFLSMSCIFTIKTGIIYIEIDKTIIRIYIILLHYLNLQKLILSTTRTEDLLNINLRIISTLIKCTNLLNEIRLSLLLSYQFAYSLEDEIKNLFISFCLIHYDNVQNEISVSTLKLLFKLIYLGIQQSIRKVYFKTQTLYIKEIKARKSQYWLI